MVRAAPVDQTLQDLTPLLALSVRFVVRQRRIPRRIIEFLVSAGAIQVIRAKLTLEGRALVHRPVHEFLYSFVCIQSLARRLGSA